MYYTKIVFVLVILIFSAYILNINNIFKNNLIFKETFQDSKKPIRTSIKMNSNNSIHIKDNMKLETVLPLVDEPGFLATFAEKPKGIESCDLSTTNNLLKTTSLKGNTWESVCSGSIDEETLIYNLCWHKDELYKDGKSFKRLMCVGIKNINENGDNRKEFTIYIKDQECIKSKWVEYRPQNHKIENKMIFFIIYDLENNLLGLNYIDKQIYRLNEIDGKWIGPINFSDIKLKRILYDWDRKMLGLDENNVIWKKTEMKWEISEWGKEENFKIHEEDTQKRIKSKFNITDLIHDKDGKLIAITNIGMLKQLNNSYSSFFGRYSDTNLSIDSNKLNEKSKNYFNLYTTNVQNQYVMTDNDILMNKTGIDTYRYDYIKLNKDEQSDKNKIQIANKLNTLLKLKRKFVNVCKNRKRVEISSDQNMNLYDNIDKLIESLDTKGYNDL